MTRIEEFISDINKELSPVLQIIEGEKQKYPLCTFDVMLCETKYAMRCQVVVEDELVELIKSKVFKFFLVDPRFNNTGRVFWFRYDYDKEGK